MVIDTLHYINLRRMKDGYNPNEETDSEEAIYQKVMDKHKKLQHENEEITQKIEDL